MFHVLWDYKTNYIPGYFYSDATFQRLKIKFEQVQFIKKALLSDILYYKNVHLPVKSRYISDINIYLDKNDVHIKTLSRLGNCVTDQSINSAIDKLFKDIYPGDIIIFIGQLDILIIKKLLIYDVALVVVPVKFIHYSEKPDTLTFIQWDYFYKYDILKRLMPLRLRFPIELRKRYNKSKIRDSSNYKHTSEQIKNPSSGIFPSVYNQYQYYIPEYPVNIYQYLPEDYPPYIYYTI